MNPSIEPLIVKFLTNEANRDELLALEKWIQEENNGELFLDYIKVNVAINRNMNKFDVQQAKDIILKRIEENRKQRQIKKGFALLRYAAIVVMAFGLGYILTNRNASIQETTPIVVDNNIEPGTDKATLTLEDGSKIALVKGEFYNGNNSKSNGAEIIYDKKVGEEVSYNTLTIPRGGQFTVQLSDGTKVWLNSETKIKYPISFVDGNTRRVELIYGEAYFDVSSSTDHKGSKFMVLNKSQEIEVLGTEFNVKAYRDEDFVYTTLVEGSVHVNLDNTTQELLPNQKLSLDVNSSTMIVSNVDVFNEISWKDGIFSFEEESLQNIMKVLSRWYDVQVTFENNDLKNEEFIGLLRKDQSLNKIIKTIKDFGIIKSYEFNGKQLILR